MIHYYEGDLLASRCGVIVHCCNCFNTFGAGIAKQIKEQYPEAYWEDQQTVRGDRDKLGTVHVVQSRGKYVVNLYGQYEHGGRGRGGVYVDYAALEHGLHAVRRWAECRAEWLKIGMPRIGCGLAGGDWVVIGPMIERAFEGRDVFVYDWIPRWT